MLLARIFHTPMVHRALRLRKRTAMRAREAKPRQVRGAEKMNTLFSCQEAFRTDRQLWIPFPGGVLPEPGYETPRSLMKYPGLDVRTYGSSKSGTFAASNSPACAVKALVMEDGPLARGKHIE
mgnify:CR=1 FL=1